MWALSPNGVAINIDDCFYSDALQAGEQHQYLSEEMSMRMYVYPWLAN